MTLVQEAYSIMLTQPDDNIRLVIELLKKMGGQAASRSKMIQWDDYATEAVDVRDGMMPEDYIRNFRDDDGQEDLF